MPTSRRYGTMDLSMRSPAACGRTAAPALHVKSLLITSTIERNRCQPCGGWAAPSWAPHPAEPPGPNTPDRWAGSGRRWIEIVDVGPSDSCPAAARWLTAVVGVRLLPRDVNVVV